MYSLYAREDASAMSSGSYFTIYRKNKGKVAGPYIIDALKSEYIKSEQSSMVGIDGKRVKEGTFPLFMQKNFKADTSIDDDDTCNEFYDSDGVLHERLLMFEFCSDFTALKEHFRLNAYVYNERSTTVSRECAEKLLQAADYILSREYNEKFEEILDNKYVELLGDGYSPFDSRFAHEREPVCIDKSSDDGYYVTFGDRQSVLETRESDSNVVFNLKRMKYCLQAFLHAEPCPWNNTELVLEYTAY